MDEEEKEICRPRTFLDEREKAVRDYVISLLLEFEESRLKGKGFDFHFVLNCKLEELTNQQKGGRIQ